LHHCDAGWILALCLNLSYSSNQELCNCYVVEIF
jgi:hypothetical protein